MKRRPNKAAIWELNYRLKQALDRMAARKPVIQDNQPDHDADALATDVAALCQRIARGEA